MLDHELLASLTERIAGTLRVSLEADGTALSGVQHAFIAPSFGEWHRLSFFPNLLTAFVTPPEIVKINAKAVPRGAVPVLDADPHAEGVGETAEAGSGIRAERPGLAEVTRAVREKKMDAVVVKDLARLTRDYIAGIE